MDMQAAATLAPMKDARPALPVSEHSLWDRAAQKRDEIANIIEAELGKQNLVGWVRRSKPGEYPLYVAVDSWLPLNETEISKTFDRSFLKLEISVDPYREHPLIYRAELVRHGRKLTGQSHVFSADEVAELGRYVVNGGSKPRFFRPRTPWLGRFVMAFIPFVPDPNENKLLRDARPTHFTPAALLGWCGAIVATMAGFAFFGSLEQYSEEPRLAGWFLLLGIACMVAAAVIAHRRPKCEAVPKQCKRTPRREYRVDAWHVSVPGAGRDFSEFRERLYNAVMLKDASSTVERELHQNFTPRGIDERERLVLTRGQATLHLHVYPFSEDAFVGWESFLNWCKWAEGDVVSTTVQDGREIAYKSLQVGVHVPSDFDLIEADVLAETTHRAIVDEIKAFLKEREIEADLDFKIIRGDRGRALTEGKDEKAPANGGAPGTSSFGRRYE